LAARFRTPGGVAVDGSELYIADSGNHKIRHLSLATNTVSTLAGTGLTSSSLDGIGLGASFNGPSGLTNIGFDLYVADVLNNKIRKFDLVSRLVSTVAGGGSPFDAVDGVGGNAVFKNPRGITSNGVDLFVADTDGNRIRKIVLATGMVTTLAGNGVALPSDGAGSSAGVSYPYGIVHVAGNLYFSQVFAVRKLALDTGVVTTLAGDINGPRGGYADGVGINAAFDGPAGLATDGLYLYLADTYNNRIRKIKISTGEVSTLAGNGIYMLADGVGASASFSYPTGITCDGPNLYVTDGVNNAIRKIVISTGAVTTIAGGGVRGVRDGFGAAASFNGPEGITTDGTSLYIADTGSSKIREIH
jgi:hypothetical protein